MEDDKVGCNVPELIASCSLCDARCENESSSVGFCFWALRGGEVYLFHEKSKLVRGFKGYIGGSLCVA